MSMIARLLGRTPLGLLQLVSQPVRFVMACAGVGFAVVLVFMQLGFMNMLFDTTVMAQRQFKADIFLVNPSGRDILNARTIPRLRLMQALGVEGVRDGEGIYVANREWIRPDTGAQGSLFMFGVRPDFDAFDNPTIRAASGALSTIGSVIFDSGGRGDYAAFLDSIRRGERPGVEVGGRTLTFEGVFVMGSTFGIEAQVVTSDQTFLALNPTRDPGALSVGLIRIEPGADAARVAARITEALNADDVMVLTRDAYIARTRDFIARESPIAFIFGFGVVMGLVVGLVIVVQILTTDVQDHYPEYATFKAIGFSDLRLLSIVYEQSVVLTVGGFVPGLLISLGAYRLISGAVAMQLVMPGTRIALVLALTAGMCLIAGTIALNRLRKVDPAEVF